MSNTAAPSKRLGLVGLRARLAAIQAFQSDKVGASPSTVVAMLIQ